ncbi:MAG: phosphatidylglycerophosphatase A [Bdellovibrionales bacterium]|nr:phosphatidylglycerophosphatase A [Bdellovibrionales bacterium]
MKKIFEFILTGAYFGKSKFMPGTVGTLWGIPLAWILSLLPQMLSLCLIIVLVILGIYLIDQWAPVDGQKDSPQIVIDEIIGFAVAMALLPQTLTYYILAFVLFRALDIMKPYPISYLDQRLKGGFGVMLDDVVAGMIANLALHIVDAYWGESLRVLI